MKRIATGLGLLVAGLTLSLSVAGGISGAAATTGTPAKATLTATGGSNPNSKLCVLARKEATGSVKQETAIEKDIESNHWAAAKKLLLSELVSGSKLEKQAVAALSSAPASVKSAGAVALKVFSGEKGIIQSSNSATQFETSINTLDSEPKLVAAEKVLDAYQTAQCGSTTSST